MSKRYPQKVTFCDTETTGLNPHGGDQIIQIACIQIEHDLYDPKQIRELKTFECKIKPDMEVPPEAARLNGYDPEVWEREAIPRRDAIVQTFELMEWTHFGGKNPGFDKNFLEWEARRLGLSWPRMSGYTPIATEMTGAWALRLLGRIPNTKQESICNFLGLGEQTHDALNDVRQCVEYYKIFMSIQLDALDLVYPKS